MRSKFWVLAAGLSAVAAAAVAPAFAATAATATAAGLGAAGAATTTAAAPAAVQMLVPRETGMDAGAVRPVANTTTAPATRPAEPDPAQGPFPTSETLLLLAGLLAVGIIVRRRQ